MGTVIPFRRGARPDPAQARESRTAATQHALTALRATGVGFLRMIRYIAFLLMLWVRKPFRFLAMLIAVPALIALPIMWLGIAAAPHKGAMIATVAGFGFGAFVLTWLYDTVLLRLAPEPIILT